MAVLQPVVEHVDGVLARVGNPDRAHRVLRQRPQQRQRRVALAGGVQDPDPAGLVHDGQHHPPAGYSRPAPCIGGLKARGDQRVEARESRSGIRRCHVPIVPGLRRAGERFWPPATPAPVFRAPGPGRRAPSPCADVRSIPVPLHVEGPPRPRHRHLPPLLHQPARRPCQRLGLAVVTLRLPVAWNQHLRYC